MGNMETQNVLVELLCEFYLEIAKIKELIRTHTLERKVMEAMNLANVPGGGDIASYVSCQLKIWIQNKDKALASGRSEYEAEMHQRVMYLMTALADELFIIDLEWPGKEFWIECLLEQAIFNQCSSGKMVYSQLDALLSGRRRGPLDDEMAAVYLQVLQLGFQGRYRGNVEKLAEYRGRIVRFAGIAKEGEGNLCQESYQHVLSSTEDSRLAPLSIWYRSIALGACIYLVVGFSLWMILA
jgi:type VI protein secretion system component VasF